MGSPVVHFEVTGNDSGELRRFYSALFGWEFDTDDALDYGMVHRAGNTTRDGLGIGGGVGAAPPGSTGHVTFYVGVTDLESTLEEVQRLGGTRLFGPDRLSDDVEIGAFADPEGHMIGLMRTKA
jgi:predicted enzyme related to lactoylglutathione lyase